MSVLWARIHGYKHTLPIERRVQDFADIGHFFDEPVKNYSSGMRSRITFGLTMAFDFDFDVLLIDELGAVGDACFRQKSEALLKEKFNPNSAHYGEPLIKRTQTSLPSGSGD